MAKKSVAAPRKGRAKKAASAPVFDADVIDIPQPEPVPEETAMVSPETGALTIEHADGSITIDPTGNAAFARSGGSDDEGDPDFNANLAEKVDGLELSRIANDLLEAIQADKQDRGTWEQMRAKAIELLGLKLEDPKGDVSRSAMGVTTSVVRDPILLESVERFRANAYAELCPSSGPVKVVNYGDDKLAGDEDARALEKDLNYYLTTTASEYYPDTRYMLWWTGLASGTFKKVYRCPLRQRPVSEYVDGTDLIVPASATDLKNAQRVTHEVKMTKDIMRAMQLEGVYRDVLLQDPMQAQINPVAAKVASVDGKAPQPQRIEDQEYTVYECYCKLDIRGYEHKQNGKPTGLPLPYRVTIEEGSREILEIRRNWDPDDEDETYRPPQIPFVLFPYSTGISRIYGSGLGHMLGNMASALTALLRISIDNGMMSNYPGLLKAKGADRQIQNEIMIPPGGCREIDTAGLRIQDAVMPMPFKDVSGNVVSLIEQTRAVAQRLGGTAELPVGEGKQDTPVGTILAQIEQATKIEGSVHKALHAAQSEEFRLLVALFREDPEALWRGNRRPAMGNAQDDAMRSARVEKFKKALANCDICPVADPNVPSDMHRNLMVTGLKQMTAGNPAYDPVKVDRYAFKQMFKMSDSDFNALLAPPVPPQPDPTVLKQLEIAEREVAVKEQNVQVAMAKAQGQMQIDQAKLAEQVAARESKDGIETLKVAATVATAANAPAKEAAAPAPVEQGMTPFEMAKLNVENRKVDMKEAELAFREANAHLDRTSKETVEALKVAQALAVHPGSDPVVDEQMDQLAAFMTPASGQPAKKSGGSVEKKQAKAETPWSNAPTIILSSPSAGGTEDEFGDDTIRTALQIARRLTSRDMRTHH